MVTLKPFSSTIFMMSATDIGVPKLKSQVMGLWQPGHWWQHPETYIEVRRPGPSTEVPGMISAMRM